MFVNDADFDENIEKFKIETITRFAKDSSNEIIEKKNENDETRIEIEN